MSKERSRYEGCQSGCDFARKACTSPHKVKEHWAGDHVTLWGPRGRATLAASKYEYPPFTRKKIARELIAIGLTTLAIAAGVIATLT